MGHLWKGTYFLLAVCMIDFPDTSRVIQVGSSQFKTKISYAGCQWAGARTGADAEVDLKGPGDSSVHGDPSATGHPVRRSRRAP